MDARSQAAVVGVFRNREQARDAIEELKRAEFPRERIGLLMQDQEQARDLQRSTLGGESSESHAGSGAGAGTVAGGIVGGVAGWLIGIGSIAIPGVGPFIAAGALATTVGGMVVGATVGAIGGALAAIGVPEEHARWYESQAHAGRILVTVQAPERADEARAILRRNGAYDISDPGSDAVDTKRIETADTSPAAAPTTIARSRAEGDVPTGRPEAFVPPPADHAWNSADVEAIVPPTMDAATVDMPAEQQTEYLADREPVTPHPLDRPGSVEEEPHPTPMPVHPAEGGPAVYTTAPESAAVGTRPNAAYENPTAADRTAPPPPAAPAEQGTQTVRDGGGRPA